MHWETRKLWPSQDAFLLFFQNFLLNTHDDPAQGGVGMVLQAGHVFAITDVFILIFHGGGGNSAHIVLDAVADVSG